VQIFDILLLKIHRFSGENGQMYQEIIFFGILCKT